MGVNNIQHISIVGLGSIGRRHLRLLRALRPEIEITLVRSGMGADWPEVELAQRVVRTIQEAIDAGAETAIICSPAAFHSEQALEWVRAAKPLLIEKPLSNSTFRLQQLADLVYSAKVPILIGYVLRYDPAAEFFQQQLSKGIHGEPICVRIECGSFLPDWRPEQDYRQSVSARKELGGGALLELSHELDYANWFFGPFCGIQAVLQHSGTLEVDVEDGAEILLETAAGFPVSIHLDFCSRISKRECRVQTTLGELVWDVLKKVVQWTDASGRVTEKLFPEEKGGLFRKQLLHFFDCLQGVSQPMISIDQGIQVMQMIEAARDSNSLGQKIRL
jgi:hypothetical protein